MDLLEEVARLVRILKGLSKEQKLKVLAFATECVENGSDDAPEEPTDGQG